MARRSARRDERRPSTTERPVELHDRRQLGSLEIGELELAVEQAGLGVEDLEVVIEAAPVPEQRQAAERSRAPTSNSCSARCSRSLV